MKPRITSHASTYKRINRINDLEKGMLLFWHARCSGTLSDERYNYLINLQRIEIKWNEFYLAKNIIFSINGA